MRIPFTQVDAFTDRPFGGNPAAVMPLAVWPDDAVLLAIAVAFVGSLVMRAPFRADVVRDRGALARLVEEGRI